MSEREGHDHEPASHDSTCQLCPVCVFLQALSDARPEVANHLLAAGRELSLALKAVVDAQAQAGEPAGERLERIPVD